MTLDFVSHMTHLAAPSDLSTYPYAVAALDTPLNGAAAADKGVGKKDTSDLAPFAPAEASIFPRFVRSRSLALALALTLSSSRTDPCPTRSRTRTSTSSSGSSPSATAASCATRRRALGPLPPRPRRPRPHAPPRRRTPGSTGRACRSTPTTPQCGVHSWQPCSCARRRRSEGLSGSGCGSGASFSSGAGGARSARCGRRACS